MQLNVRIERFGSPVEWLPILSEGEITLGRDVSNHVVLRSPEVSRRHLRVQADGSKWLLTDCSANGTRVGGHWVKRSATQCEEGTPVQVGCFSIRLYRADGDRAAAPTAPVENSAEPHLPAPEGLREGRATHAAVSPAVRKRMHALLLENLELAQLKRGQMEDAVLRPKVRAALRRISGIVADELPEGADVPRLIDEICDEALGLGPLEKLIQDRSVSEIMVVDPATIYIERRGRIERAEECFTDAEAVRAIIERIVTPLGRRIDESTPVVDARLPDGSRVHAIIPPLATRGPAITIRKFSNVPFTMERLVEHGAVTEGMARFLHRCVLARKNILISGGTGSGKTTLLNVLSASIPAAERIITIEDAAELQLRQPHVVSLESRRANVEGRGEYPIRELVRNSLRMRPDRIVVGEVRGGEALDMLQAMNTGHQGSMTTAHANSPREALDRLETLALMGGLELSLPAVRKQIVSAVDIVVQTERFSSDGTRRVTAISEVVGIDDEGAFEERPIFTYEHSASGPRGEVEGEFRQSGYLPSFLGRFLALGLVRAGEPYL
ncbi:MAG: ATPase, T2SS/T4P/T4SS family [Myxococcota bacterium]